MLREKNPDAAIITTPWDELDGKTILRAIEKVSLADELLAKMRAEHEAEEAEHHHHHHHDEDEHHHHHDHDEDECDDPDCACHHHHDDDEDDHDHEHHHHHDHDHEEHEHHHHHDHDGDECDDPDCCCHDHHHHHHADEVFTSWGVETPKTFTAQGIDHILEELDSGEYGKILRAKGIVNGEGGWLEFDYVPEEHDVRPGHPDYTGRLCVIGAELKEDALKTLFGV